MTIQRGDYVRPNTKSAGLPASSVWRVACTGLYGEILLEPENEPARCVNRRATQGCRFQAWDFDKVVKVRGTWVTVDDAEGFMTEPVCFARALAKAVQTTAIANDTGPVSDPNAVDPWAAAVAAADSMVVSAEQKLVDAKEQARKQREVAEQKAKEQAKAEREAKAKAEARANRDALQLRLQADERLADATKALILEVLALVKYATPERIAPQEVFQHADQLDALAKSYGYKIVRAGSKCIVAKA